MSEDIVFDDPSELGQLLETDQAPVEIDHSKIVQEIQKASQVKPTGNKAQGSPAGIPEGANSGAMPHEKKDRTLCIDGKMMKESAALPLLAETVDPESMNFLLARQKIKLQPSILEIVGRDFRYPVIEELEAAVGKVCPFCGEPISQEEAANWREIGSIVTYGQAPEGQPLYWHWEHLALQALLLAKGHPQRASEMFGLDISEMTAMKQYFRAIPWGRLGFLREEGH